MKPAPIALALLALLCFAAPLAAQTGTDERLKDDMGLLRMQAIYPEPGEQIQDPQPMITVDAGMLEAPLDPQTVVLTLNGSDITDDAEVTPAYIVYTPPDSLLAGTYEVRVTAKDVNKADIEPLAWTFIVLGEAGQVVEEEADNTTGRLVMSMDYAQADYVPQSAVDISQLFREKEGTKLNTDLNFTNASGGRTILAAYHRETQYYTDIELDKARMNYYDSNFTAAVGNFWFRLSDLTVYGTELAGIRIDKEAGPWGMMVFAGRTQDPSTGGTFKQNAAGLRGSYKWNANNMTYVTVLAAHEKDDPFYAQSAAPSRDRLAGIYHEYTYNEHVRAAVEVSGNERRVLGDSWKRSGAARARVSASDDDYSLEGEYYAIDDGFMPIAEGSSKLLKNDRDGFRIKGSYKPWGFLTFGGEYEDYDTESTNQNTKRDSAFVGVSHGAIQTLSYRHGSLTSDGADSETNALVGVFLVPAAGNFTETRIAVGWQNIDYATATVRTDTTVTTYSLNTWYRDRLGLGFSYSHSDTDNLIDLTQNKNTNLSMGLTWNIIPSRWIWTGRYESLKNTGSSADNREKRVKNAFKYIFNKTCAVNVGFDRITYSDTVTPAYNYDEDIYRSGVEWNF